MTSSRTLINLALSDGSADTVNSPIANLNSVSSDLLVQSQTTARYEKTEDMPEYHDDHPDVVTVKNKIIKLCQTRFKHTDVSGLKAPLDVYIKQALEHFIKECIEVFSFLETENNNHSIIYYANALPWAVKRSVEIVAGLDPFYLVNRTINVNNASLTKDKVDYTTIINNMAGKALDKSKLARATTKVYFPTCYGYGNDDKNTEEGLYQKFFSTTKKFLESGILPENMYVYFGPYEPVGYSVAEAEVMGKEVLQEFLMNTADYLKAKNLNLLVHKDNNNLFPINGLIAANWVESAKYKCAKNIFFTLFVDPNNADLLVKFKDDIYKYLLPKINKSKQKAAMTSPKALIEHLSPTKNEPNTSLVEAKLKALKSQLEKDLSLYESFTPQGKIETISKYIAQGFSLINNHKELTNQDQIELLNYFIKMSVCYFKELELESWALNTVLNRLLEIVGEFGLLEKLEAQYGSYRVSEIVKAIKYQLCPLEMCVENFIKGIKVIEAQNDKDVSNKHRLATDLVRDTLDSLKNTAKIISAMPTYRLYVPILIVVISSPLFNTINLNSHSLLSFMKKEKKYTKEHFPIRRKLIIELRTLARWATACWSWKTSRSVDFLYVESPNNEKLTDLLGRHLCPLPISKKEDITNSASALVGLRDELTAFANEEFPSFKTSSLRI